MTEKEAKQQCLMIKKTSIWLKKEIAATMKLVRESKSGEETLLHLNNLICLKNKAGAEVSRIDKLMERMGEEDSEF
jgi:predicted ABC-type transport system involved in lysophospholipase L1 biosynthesis ATPase subunit